MAYTPISQLKKTGGYIPMAERKTQVAVKEPAQNQQLFTPVPEDMKVKPVIQKSVFTLPNFLGGGTYTKTITLESKKEARDISIQTKNEIRGGTFQDTLNEVNHIISVAHGGTNDKENLIALKDNPTFQQKFQMMFGKKFETNDFSDERRQEGRVAVEKALDAKVKKGEITDEEYIVRLKGWDFLRENKPKITDIAKDTAKTFLKAGSGLFTKAIPSILKIINPFSYTIPSEKKMVFNVGENLTPEQKQKAEAVVRKLPSGYESEPKFGGSENFGAVTLSQKEIEKLDKMTPKKAAQYVQNKSTIEMAMGFIQPAKTEIVGNVEKYVAEQVAKQNLARVAEQSGIIGNLSNFFKEIKSKLVDSNAPIEDILSKNLKQNKIILKPTENITNQIDRVYRSPVLAGQFARDNGLEAIIKNVDNLENLDQYMIAKQAKDVTANGIKIGRDIIKDQLLIDTFAPKYEPLAQQVNQYSQKLLDYSVDSGLVSKETADLLKNKYPNYVPMNRIFNELEKGQGFGTKAVASLSKQTVVQKLKGSEREIESPITSLLAKTNDAFVQGEKNKAAKMLIGYKDLPNNPFQLRELSVGESAVNTVSVLDNGVKKTFETTKDVANAAKALNVQQLNILGKIFATPVRIAKVGITGINLPFIASNIAKDQVTAAINSSNALKTSIINPLNFIKALYEAVGHKEFYQEMVRAGGAGTSFDIARNQVKQTVERIRADKNIGSKILYTVRHPSELLRTVENIVGRSEELTRIQQYGGTKQALLKQGMSEADAVVGAAKAARENTVNFARRGEWGQVLNSTFLYLNASIQGTRTFVRNMATKPIATATKIALTVFTPVATATLWNLSDPKRKEAYQDIAEYEKQGNIIIIPPNPTKDENGKWNVIKIPLSQEINNIASLARRPIEQSFGLDPVRAGEVATAFIGTVSPINPTKGSIASTLTPQAIKPSIEALTNQNLFTGYKQVPDTLSKLSPELQVKPNTAGTAIELGKLLKQSPIKIEEFIKGTMGGVGSQLIHLSDLALAGLDIIPKDQIHGQKVIEAITARFMKATGGNADEKSNKQLETILIKQADDRFKTKQEAELLYDELKKLPKEEANAKADELLTTNPILYDALKTVAEDNKKGLDYNDRLMNQLGVTNGERAKFIWETLKTLKTKEEKNAYISQLQDKGIISDNILDQLKQLKDKGY
jgi:hypothetical protein